MRPWSPSTIWLKNVSQNSWALVRYSDLSVEIWIDRQEDFLHLLLFNKCTWRFFKVSKQEGLTSKLALCILYRQMHGFWHISCHHKRKVVMRLLRMMPWLLCHYSYYRLNASELLIHAHHHLSSYLWILASGDTLKYCYQVALMRTTNESLMQTMLEYMTKNSFSGHGWFPIWNFIAST